MDGIDGLGPLTALPALLMAWLFTYAMHSTLILGGLWLTTLFLKRSAQRLRDGLWKCGLVGGVLSATLQLSAGLEPFAAPLSSFLTGEQPQSASLEPGLARPSPGPGVPAPQQKQADVPQEEPTLAPLAEQSAWRESRSKVSANPLSPRHRPQPRNTQHPATLLPVVVGEPLRTLLLFGWGVSALLLLLWFMKRRLRLRLRLAGRQPVRDEAWLQALEQNRRALALKRPISLSAIAGLPSPVCLGSREICLPWQALAHLEADQRQALLAHEVAHIARRDPAWLLVCGLLESLLFFQPLNRLARRRYQAAAENLCDGWAVRKAGGGLPLASCLVEVAGWMAATKQRVGLLPGMADKTSSLKRRVEGLLKGASPEVSAPKSFRQKSWALAALCLGVVLLPGAGPDLFQAAPKQHPGSPSAPPWFQKQQPLPPVSLTASLGLFLATPSEALAAQLGLEREQASLVVFVVPGLAAEQTGLRRFDVITAINGKARASRRHMQRLLAQTGDGDGLQLALFRRGRRRSMLLRLPPQQRSRKQPARELWRHWLAAAANLAQVTGFWTGKSWSLDVALREMIHQELRAAALDLPKGSQARRLEEFLTKHLQPLMKRPAALKAALTLQQIPRGETP